MLYRIFSKKSKNENTKYKVETRKKKKKTLNSLLRGINTSQLQYEETCLIHDEKGASLLLALLIQLVSQTTKRLQELEQKKHFQTSQGCLFEKRFFNECLNNLFTIITESLNFMTTTSCTTVKIQRLTIPPAWK